VWHSHFILRAYRNPEVAAYIARVRDEEDPQTHRKEPDSYVGFEDLAKQLIAVETRSGRPVPTLQKPSTPK
jgi:hypothetical protein